MKQFKVDEDEPQTWMYYYSKVHMNEQVQKHRVIYDYTRAQGFTHLSVHINAVVFSYIEVQECT